MSCLPNQTKPTFSRDDHRTNYGTSPTYEVRVIPKAKSKDVNTTHVYLTHIKVNISLFIAGAAAAKSS